jgi:hypothetical protein
MTLINDKNITEKIAEIIDFSLKKTVFYESNKKINKIVTGVGSFIFIVGICNIFINIYVYNKSKKIIYDYEIINNRLNKTIKNIEILHSKLEKLLEESLENNEKKCVTESTSTSDIELSTTNSNICDNINDDNELLYECYDNIPCNNNKKITATKSGFLFF